MLAEISEFRWHVFSGGYECKDVKSADGRGLRVVVPKWEEEGSLVERYPLEADPALHRAFAGLALTEEAILAFANKWGPLKNAHEFELQDFGEEDVELTGWVGDATDDWFAEIQRMKALLGLWDLLKGGKEHQFSDLINLDLSGDDCLWTVELRFKEVPGLGRVFQFSERNWPGFSDLLDLGGKQALARMCLIELVNDSLWGSCSPCLSLGERPNEVTLCFTPHNLNAALWLMFVQEILGEKQLKQCLYCKRHFESSKEESGRHQRSDKKYCSPKCRAAAFKERRGGQG